MLFPQAWKAVMEMTFPNFILHCVMLNQKKDNGDS